MKYVKPEMEVMEFNCVPITNVSTDEGISSEVPGKDLGDVDW